MLWNHKTFLGIDMLLLANKAPNLINLDFSALDVPHLGVLDSGAFLADPDAQAHDGARCTSVTRSIARMLLPSASIAITLTFFSNGRLFAILVLRS